MQIIKQSTAANIQLGPFLDDTDGKTAETALTIANTDIQISKNGGTFANKNSGGGTHDADGWYKATLDTTDTNTVGLVDIQIAVSGALPVMARFQVIEEAIYDGIYASGATSVPADTVSVSGDTTAADNLELMYDGTGYTDETAPSSRAQVGSLSSGSAAISTVANSFTKTTGDTETNTYTSTHVLDGTLHSILDDAGTTDVYYEFNVGGNGVPVEFLYDGYVNSNNDTYTVYAYNWDGSSWDQVGSLEAGSSITVSPHTFQATNAHVGTGTDLGKVRFRFYSTDGTNVSVDRLLCSYAVVSQSVGYALGSIWVDTSTSNTNTENYVDGVADNPVSTWAAALTLSSQLGIKNFRAANGTSITLTGAATGYTITGDGWTLALGSQAIGGICVEGASVTGVGTEGATVPLFKACKFGAVTLPPSIMHDCGFGNAGGQFTASTDGQYVIVNGYSLVPGSGSPALVFTGTGSVTGINNRGWKGGATYTLDSDCTLSHEVLAGGGTTITTGGGNAEVRGITRSLTVTMAGTETVQFVGTTGPVALSGTTTGTVNLYGVSSSLSDSTSAATVNNDTVNATDVTAILDDTGTGGVVIAGSQTVATVTDVTNEVTADMTKISGSATAANSLEASALGIHSTTIATAASATSFTLTAGSAIDDVYTGRVIVVTSGTYAGQATVITAYTGSSQTVTVNAMEGTLSVSDNIVIV